MCHQITYTLPCEHTRTDTVYCADAPLLDPSSSKSSSSRSSKSSSKHKDHGAKKQHHHHHHHRESNSGSRDGSGRSNSPSTKRRPCRNLTSQSIAYPLPPSFQGSPSAAASSPLLPKCTLPRCPFELRNRCWNCCWCGKGWNEQGRCSCVMIIEGNEVRCEHICCETCTPAGLV